MFKRVIDGARGVSKRLIANINHVMLGAVLMGIGVFLISQQNYFSWPPVMAPIENDDTFGVFFIMVGVAMIGWSIDKKKTARANHFILTSAAVLMAVLTFFQFFHWYLFGIPMPWISNLGLLGVIVVLARRSDSK
ncbi:hypothetical protein [Lactobacillus brevis] [Lactiplantibacillus mudanjiangensis]|uniref:hypothetical protein n=1 Tax=Lactiplantibacillus mudanjiangensis TaxID=1296538 RepID=UPI001015A906|nr:hypothetical protein [Lactobacillus brevis] [Lactiplantibacillus mudanjiangensis]